MLIDTPGIGSTLKHNTEAAFQVLPECDAVLFVVSADPPITELEIDYLRRLKSETTRIFYVVNKADYLQPEDRRTLVDFLQKTLAEKALIDAEPQIFCVSARDGLTARETGAEQLLAASGIGALEDHLVRSLVTEKRRWLDRAIRSKAADVLTHAAAELDLRQRALAMPLEELAANGTRQALRHGVALMCRKADHSYRGRSRWDHRCEPAAWRVFCCRGAIRNCKAISPPATTRNPRAIGQSSDRDLRSSERGLTSAPAAA